MTKTTNESAELKLKRGLSIRLDPEPLASYEDCVGAASLSVTGALRAAVQSMLGAYRKLEADGVDIACNFTRKPKSEIDHFPELVGGVIFDVVPPTGMTVEQLHQLVFVIPEFFLDNGHEPYRVDSAHFQRVVYNGREVDSTKVRRNTLSFRLINGAWRASVFDYDSALDPSEIEQRVANAVKKTIAATIACYLTHQLPDTRILTADEVAELNANVLPHLLAR